MRSKKQQPDEVIESMWASSFDTVTDYESFKQYVANSRKHFTHRQKLKAVLTEVMLLRSLRRYSEADEIETRHKTAFNSIEDILYAHRWQRMQVVEEARLGNTLTTGARARELAHTAALNNWIEEEIRAHVLIHLIEMIAGHFKPALESAQRVKLLAHQHKHEYFLLQSAWGIPNTYFHFGHHKKALEECIAIKHHFGNNLGKQQHLAFYNLLANCYQTQNMLAEAIKIYRNMLHYLKSSGENNPSVFMAASSNMATALASQGKFKEAERTYIEMDAFAQKANIAVTRLESLMSLARLYVRQQNYDSLKSTLSVAEEISEKVNIARLKVGLLEIRMQYEKGVGNADKAFATAEKYFALYREWQQLEDSEKLKAIEMKYELQVEQLNQQVMKKELQLREQEMQLLNSLLSQKDKLIGQFSDYFIELEETSIRRKEIFVRLRDMVSTIKNTQQQEQGNYTAKFNEAHHKACEKLITKYPAISAKEADTAVMLMQGLNNKEIATLTLTTVRNIEKHRLNLRKKMKIAAGEDLVRKIRKVVEAD